MSKEDKSELKDIERKIPIKLVFWCTDERHIDDLQKMLQDACSNGDNGRYGGYGFSFEVPSEKKLLKKLRKSAG